MRIIIAIALLIAFALGSVQAEPRHRNRSRSHNYIIERQEAYQVQRVPTSRLIIGEREIDIYPNGMMFEKNNLVGIRRP